jgi:hypothetical protein
MLPAFDDYGIYRRESSTFEELAERFGAGSDERESEISELRQLLKLLLLLVFVDCWRTAVL